MSNDNELSYQEMMILSLYRKLFGKCYDCEEACTNNQGIIQKHIDAQKVGFIFCVLGIPVGDYNFSWDLAGPYSSTLQNILREVDKKGKEVREFYKDNDDVILRDLLNNDYQISLINKMCGALGQSVQKDEKGAELLGSLLYISSKVMPFYGLSRVKKELIRRKNFFGDTDYISKIDKAWEQLEELGLVPSSAEVGS